MIDGVIAVALFYMLFLVGSAALETANRRSGLRRLTTEAQALYEAFSHYEKRNLEYPAAYTESAFEVETLNPLSNRGYYRGPLRTYLVNGKVDAYDSPDDRGLNREFWVEMTLRADPSIRVLVARSDDAPLGGGAWREGVFVIRNGETESP